MANTSKPDFEGVLFRIGKPSTGCPTGVRGHNILITSSLVESMIEQINKRGCVLNALGSLDTHPKFRSSDLVAYIFGRVTFAEIRGDQFYFSGELTNWTDSLNACLDTQEPLGVSYEMEGVHILDMNKSIWKAHKGCLHTITVVKQNNAAHKKDCSFRFL